MPISAPEIAGLKTGACQQKVADRGFFGKRIG